jgi:hypothetical protein
MYRLIALLALAAVLLPTSARAQDDVGFSGGRDAVRTTSYPEVGFPRSRSEGETNLPAFPGQFDVTPTSPDLTSLKTGFPEARSVALADKASGTVSFPGSYRGKPATVTVRTHGRRQQVYRTLRRPKGQRNRPMTAREYTQSRYSPIRIYSGPRLTASGLMAQLKKSNIFVTRKEFDSTVRALKDRIGNVESSVSTVKQQYTSLEARVAALEAGKGSNGDEQTETGEGGGFSFPHIPTWGWVVGIILLIIIVVILILVRTGVISK